MAFNKTSFESNELSFEKIAAIYPNNDEYRISKNTFAPGDGTSGISRAGKCYVVEGKCKFTFKDIGSIVVEAGEIFDFPDSHFEITSDKILGVKYAMVWNLKELFKKYGQST